MRWLRFLSATIFLAEVAAEAETSEQAEVAAEATEQTLQRAEERRTKQYAVLGFERWFKSLSGKAPAVEVFHSEEYGFSVRATKDIEEGDEMIVIPKEMIFSRQAALDKNIADMRGFTPAIRNAFARITYDEDLLSLLLLRERALGNESFFEPYLSILPDRAVPLPSTLTDQKAKDMLDEPAYFRAKTAAKRRSDRFSRIRDQLRVVLYGLPHEKEMSTLEAFVWADSIVGSRALTLAKTGKFLMPFADMLNYAPHPQTREQNHGKFFEQNHRMMKDSFIVFADRNTLSGQEVFEDYGDNDNELYFHAFGFTPKNNPFDCVTIRLPAPDTKSKLRPLVRKLRVPQNPEGCFRPDRPMPDQALYHLHMLSMSEAAAGECLELVTEKPEAGAVACFNESYTIDSAWMKLQEIVSKQLEEGKTPTKPIAEDESTLKPMAVRLSDVQAVVDVHAASREKLMRVLLESPAPAALDPQDGPDLDEAAVDEVEDMQQLHGLISESTQKYLGALRAGIGVSENKTWPDPVRAMLLALHGEVAQILANPNGDCSGKRDAEPDFFPPVTDVSVAAFNTWFAGRMKLSKARHPLRVAAVQVPGLRLGLVATEAVAAEEVYLAVPPGLVIDHKSALISVIGPPLKEVRSVFSRSDSFHEILLHLWHERFVLQEVSDWWPYLSLLPGYEELSSPHFCDASVLETALKGSTLVPVIRAQRKGLQDKYDKVISPIFRKIPFFKKLRKHMTYARYEWSNFIMNSRSIWWGGDRHLVPMLDFVNCKSAEGMRVHSTAPDEDGDPGMRSVLTKASVALEEGAPVFENYGQPNHVHFMSHGFVVEENEHDCYRWEQAPGRETHCLHPKKDMADALLTKVGGGYIDRGRTLMRDDFKKRLKLYPEETPSGLAGPEAVAYAFAAVEKGLLTRLLARIEERIEESQQEL